MELVVFDSSDRMPVSDGFVVTWNGYAQNDGVLSLLCFIEENKERLRSKYTNWISEVGHYKINGKSIIDSLSIDNGFSLWWMSLFVEKSLWKSPQIVDALRLFSLEEILLEKKPQKVKLISDNKALHKIIENLCNNLNIEYTNRKKSGAKWYKTSIRSIYNSLPDVMKAFLSLARYVTFHWTLRKALVPKWYSGDKSIFFCSYFDNIDSLAANKGSFYSFYWKNLLPLTVDLGFRTNWLQLFVADNSSVKKGKAVEWLSKFNASNDQQGLHAFLSSYLSLSVILQVLLKFFRVRLKIKRLTGIEAAFQPKGSYFSLWPIYAKDWHDSLKGSVAINNVLLFCLFDSAMKNMPSQQKGFYLCENQAWERAFIFSWRKYGHGKLIAVPHSTRSFWDLRFFRDQSSTDIMTNPLPIPDITAVNGRSAWNIFLTENYKGDDLVECEALRYIYLAESKKPEKSSLNSRPDNLKVLILGDYTASRTLAMLELVASAHARIIPRCIFTIKPHPNFLVKNEDCPSLKFKIVTEPLEKILPDYDIAFSSNKTSASVDAYLSGLPMIVMLDDNELNMSPISGEPHVIFVSTSVEFAKSVDIMRGSISSIKRYTHKNEFFYLNQRLPRWKTILKNN
jgi:surface carbohydrate biosynthesis protein (TIGR04326 family)